MWLVVDRPIVVNVAVDQTVYQTDRPYSYLVPSLLSKKAKPGCRVLVPFGKGNMRKTGMIMSIDESSHDQKLKNVISVLDEQPVLSNEMLSLAEFIKERTFCSLYNAIRVLLPPGINYKVRQEYELSESANLVLENLDDEMLKAIDFLKNVGSAVTKESFYLALELPENSSLLDKLISKGVIVRSGTAVRGVKDATLKMVRTTELCRNYKAYKLTKKQSTAAEFLNDIECCSVKEFQYFTGFTAVVLNGLCKKGLVEFFEQEYYRNPYANSERVTNNSVKLTENQEKAYSELLEEYSTSHGSTALLYGVTGSGKTQVFLKLCDEVAGQGRGVIVMVPEIALTPQTLNIFHKRFGDKVAVFHSAMSQGQRLDEWKRVKRGEALVAVGTRSAVFAPFEDVGLIIMDEEHESTYKSEMSPYFHARDIAKYRIARSKGLLLLSSATPSIESYSLALSGKYRLCKLEKRFGSASLPDVEIVDMRQEISSGNSGIISNALYDRINEALDSGHQVILLLNRRGFNTYVSCSSCGQVVTCENCSISMTYHSANNRLMCHYCGKSLPYVDKCPQCESVNMRYSGLGTQKAEAELKMLFPNAKILRMDADSTMTKADYEGNLKAFADGDYDIILGTQMVAKGLDFPKVTVVGVLNSDISMHNNDYRSYERTFSLLTQVVGRSGRGADKGTAVIQTVEPDSKLIELAAKQDYNSFYESEILTRRLMTYPPYCDIATVNFLGQERKITEDAARCYLDILKNAVLNEYKSVKIIALGPTAAAVLKVNNNYRFKIILKYKNSAEFRNMINDVTLHYLNTAFSKKVTASVNVNPENLV